LFQNLIGNAVKLTKEEGLVEIAAEELETSFIFFDKDNGIGMAKEIHSKIFETFKTFTNSKHYTGIRFIHSEKK
jgi:signal transduction histidine kinase